MKLKTITIIKKDHRGREVWRYTGEILEESPNGILVEAYFNRSDLPLNGILLKQNDRFLEFYSREKWFNIYEIYDRDDGLLKAWYCNVTRPARWTEGVLCYDDLALDLLVFPSGRQIELDRDEFELLDLSDSDQTQVRRALEELRDYFSVQGFDIRSLL